MLRASFSDRFGLLLSLKLRFLRKVEIAKASIKTGHPTEWMTCIIVKFV
jgi:hypothetical protein